MLGALPRLPDFEASLDDETIRYLNNKNRGGENGSKGVLYELIFLACVAAKLLCEFGATPTSRLPRLHWQLIGFVDDACVEHEDTTEFYQIKNVESLSWTTGEHPIYKDFELQYQVSSKVGNPSPRTSLVVPDIELQAKLTAEIPDTIKLHSNVHYFPYLDGVLNRIVQENDEVRDSLKRITRSENPTIDQLEAVLGVLYLACMHTKGGKSLWQMYEVASRQHPNQIRLFETFNPSMYVMPKFEDALKRIQNLSYNFDRGFFNWSALGTSGTFGVSCANEKFVEFQKRVIQLQPTTFDDLEEFLL
jgi:NADH:ubiquinone oxidoreductase subunit C